MEKNIARAVALVEAGAIAGGHQIGAQAEFLRVCKCRMRAWKVSGGRGRV